MAATLVKLAPAYEAIYYLVELPAEQLQAVMQYASQLQALAQSLQMKIHMVSSKAAETTKVGTLQKESEGKGEDTMQRHCVSISSMW